MSFHQEITERAHAKLDERLQTSASYDRDEIEQINSLDHKLISHKALGDDKSAERLRALARLAQTELKPPRAISSHRKVIGPIIVFGKKLLWPLFASFMKDFVEAQREYNSLLLEEYLAHTASPQSETRG